MGVLIGKKDGKKQLTKTYSIFLETEFTQLKYQKPTQFFKLSKHQFLFQKDNHYPVFVKICTFED